MKKLLATLLLVASAGIASANPTPININVDCISERNDMVRTADRMDFFRNNGIQWEYSLVIKRRNTVQTYHECMTQVALNILTEQLMEATGLDRRQAYHYWTNHDQGGLSWRMGEIATSYDSRARDAINSLHTHRILQPNKTWYDYRYIN